jgi:outer membrane protein assembly factor BamB
MVGLSLIEACGTSDPPYVGGYRIQALLGTGGFGTVYAAEPRDHPDEFVAIKVVHSYIARLPDFQTRFEREIAAIRRVRSVYVAGFVDAGPADRQPWLATELIPGLPLNRIVDACGPLPEPLLWRLGAGIIEALTAMHGVDVVHRDLKPQNVLITAEGPRIIDFSLVQLADLPRLASSRLPMASYQYAAPEQLLHGLQAADRPADVFALGATLFFAATGRPPPRIEGWLGAASQGPSQQADPARPPPDLDYLIEQCLYRAQNARLSLPQVKAEFTRRADAADSAGNSSFAALLPADALALLERYRQELANMARGELGPRPAPPAERDDRPVPLPSLTVPDQFPAAAADLPALTRTVSPTEAAETPFGAWPDDVTAIAPEPGAVQASHSVAWTQSFGSWIRAPVTAGGGMVIVPCLNGTLAMLDPDDGTVLWSRPLGARLHSAALFLPGHRGTLGTAYAGTADGGVHVIDVTSHDYRHRRPFGANAAITGPPVAARDRVYVLSADGTVYFLSAYNPALDVVFRLGGPATGALAAAGDMIFAAGTDGCVHAIDTTIRRAAWRLPTGGLVLSAPVPVSGRLYVAGTDGLLHEVDIENHHKRATVEIGVPVHAGLVHQQWRLYVGGSDGVVRAYDISHDRHDRPDLLGICRLEDEVTGLAAAHGSIYATAGDRVVEIDVTAERPRPMFRLGCLAAAAPVISGRSGYVAGLGGFVSRVDLR